MPKIAMISCVLGILFLVGCGPTHSPRTVVDRSTVIESSHVDPKSGNLIALWMTRTEGTPKGELVPVLVPHEYAIYILWPSPEGYPEPPDRRLFVFYDNVVKKSYQTTDYDAFLAILAKQPKNITLLQIETCTVSRCYMPKDQWNRLEEVLATGNRHWAVNAATGSRISMFCYCECLGGFVYPAEKD